MNRDRVEGTCVNCRRDKTAFNVSGSIRYITTHDREYAKPRAGDYVCVFVAPCRCSMNSLCLR